MWVAGDRYAKTLREFAQLLPRKWPRQWLKKN
jgi:hypothetical protein